MSEKLHELDDAALKAEVMRRLHELLDLGPTQPQRLALAMRDLRQDLTNVQVLTGRGRGVLRACLADLGLVTAVEMQIDWSTWKVYGVSPGMEATDDVAKLEN